MTTAPSIDLPVPYDRLIELGLSAEQIEDARQSAPLVVACQAAEHPGSWFDVDRARRALKALGAFKHTKGRWAGVRMTLGAGLDPWQVVWVIAPIFGWVFHDAETDRVVRVIRSAWVEVPRKNGKSTLSSGVSGVLLLADGEMGAEVYNAAGSTLQASRVFEDAKRMLMTSPAARKRVEPLKEVVRVPRTGGILRVLSRVAETAHGLNVSGAIIDEVHVLRLHRGLVEAIETGVGARDQPLILFITTADEAEQGTIYDEKHLYVRNLANNVVQDPRQYGVIWAAESTDDPYDESTWRKANPGLGKSPTLAYMRGESLKAQNNPTYRPTFLRLSLNLRTADQSRWFKMADWDDCGSLEVSRAKLAGRRAWGGVDLSAVSDLSAWMVWVEPVKPGAELELLTRIWVPEARIEELEKKLQVPLRDWVAQGFIEAPEGDVIDYAAIESAILGDCRFFDMQKVSYDRMFAGQMVQNLAEKSDVAVRAVAQTFMGLSPAAKEWERLVVGRSFRHDKNPALRWMASVVEVKTDGLDNIRPVKPDRRKSSARVDAIQAGVTALDGWVRREKTVDRKVRVFR
jgi:phage terminase large subunit-like protein